MKRADATYYRYGENDSRPFLLNGENYLLAHQVCRNFKRSITPQSDQPLPQVESDRSKRHLPTLRVAEENRLLPVDGYFSFYSDLLGFTKEVSNGGMDGLRDYFGGALAAAAKNPKVSVYLVSDSCFAFAPVEEANEFVCFISDALPSWLSDGLMPRSSIGYGSFVARDPFPCTRPPNFFGTQITGTALPDAVEVLEVHKPSGSRILLSQCAWRHWPAQHAPLVMSDGQFKEFIPERHLGHCLFEFVYYLLCLREHEPGTRQFKHYVWSCASRARAAGSGVLEIGATLVAPHFAEGRHEIAVHQVEEALAAYEPLALRQAPD